ncbi:MAG TPA: purine-nucleoside phosphorylase [Candidatus Anoxymicrobiaceae bacterium]
MLDPREITSRVDEAAEYLVSTLGPAPRAAVVLGTGWDHLDDSYDVISEVDFAGVPGMHRPGVHSHAGNIKVIETRGGPLLVQEGRVHCYEGYSTLEASFPIWVYAALGVELVVSTAAAGGLNPAYTPGNLIIVADHIFLWGADPLVGVNDEAGRDRFMPAGDFYPELWQDKLKECLPVTVESEKGTYAFNTGPSFETDAEATLLRIAGADAVGMSLPVEAIVARYLGLQFAAVCCISNTLLPMRSLAVAGPASLIETVNRTVAGLDGFLDRIASSLDMIG